MPSKLKRRKKVTICEFLLPLVLFLILLGLRSTLYVKRVDSDNFAPKSLPSSGALAVLQEFCPNVDSRDDYGYPEFKGNTIGNLLDQVYSAYNNSVILRSKKTPIEQLKNINETFADMMLLSHKTSKTFNTQSVRDMKFKNILKNSSDFKEYLKQELNLTNEEVFEILNSNVDTRPLQSSLGGSLISLASIAFPQLLSKPTTKIEEKQQAAQLSAFKTTLLSPESLDSILCQTNKKVLKKKTIRSSESQQRSLHEKLCGKSNVNKLRSLSNQLSEQLNDSAASHIFSSVSPNSSFEINKASQEHAASLIEILPELDELVKFLEALANLSSMLPQNACDVQEQIKYSSERSKTQGKQTSSKSSTVKEQFLDEKVTTFHKKEKKSHTKTSREKMIEQFSKAWLSFQPVICGQNKDNEQHELTISQKRKLGKLLYVFTSNPKILYAPNTTHVNSVIEKANSSFATIDNITKAGEVWLLVSKAIRKDLKNSTVVNTLKWLSSVKRLYKKQPILFKNLTYDRPEIQKILSSNFSLPNASSINNLLDKSDNVVCLWKSLVGGISINWFQGFKSEQEAVDYATLKAYHEKASVFATVVFDVDNNGRLPSHVRYKIRQNASLTQDTRITRLSYWRADSNAWNLLYYNYGFVWVQDVIERSLIWEFVGHEVVNPGVYVHAMPYPCYLFDAFLMNMEHFLPIAMIFSFVYSVTIFVQQIVYEKEQRLKEVMKMMGLSNAMHWLAWFITIFLQMQVVVTIICVLLKFGSNGIFPKSNFFIIWIFFTAFAISNIAFCFFVSALFSKAKIASACSGILYFLTYLPYAYMTIQEFMLQRPISFLSKMAASLISTTAFGLGTKYFAIYEVSSIGVQWENIAKTPFEGDSFNLLQAIIMLVVDACLYSTLTWYIEAVFPGQYGLPRPWYFPLTISYWTGRGKTGKSGPTCSWLRRLFNKSGYFGFRNESQERLLTCSFIPQIEQNPSIPVGIQIQNLTKVYKDIKAVDNLTLNFYQNQITAFLGHNGAGKSTTLSILTGLFPPTSGTALIYNLDITRDMLKIRESLGMCPQYNVLFDDLTVEDHLWLYGRLKNLSSFDISRNMDIFLADVGLQSKRKSCIKYLSGGMKRKLSVAISFVGDSKTIILDEPTAGVDPHARQEIWDLIIRHKQGRTILLSTHHMDEADLLGDRIAIIANGQLQCCGSSLFLKSKYGEGYKLTLLKEGQCGENQTVCELERNEKNKSEKILNVVRSCVPTATVNSNSKNQISLNLPHEASHSGSFHQLFTFLANHIDNLDITGYGLTVTTLQEIFLKIDSFRSKETKSSKSKITSSTAEQRRKNTGDTIPIDNIHRTTIEDTESFKDDMVDYSSFSERSTSQTNDDQSLLYVQTMACDNNNRAPDTYEEDENLLGSRHIPMTVAHCRKLQGLLVKRFHYSRRSVKAVFYQIMLPAVFVAIAMCIALSLPTPKEPPAITLSPSEYFNLTHPRGNFIPYSDQSAMYPIKRSPEDKLDANASQLIKTFFLPSGIGDSCVLAKSRSAYSSSKLTFDSSFAKKQVRRPFKPECRDHFINSVDLSLSSSLLPTNLSSARDVPCACNKDGNTYSCWKDYGHFPVTYTATSSDHLIDITGKAQIMPYLMYTIDNYHMHRYGALSFNEIRRDVKPIPWPSGSPMRKLAVREAAQVFFNHKGLHSMPMYLNVFNNALLRANLPSSKGNPAEYGITAINQPMNKTTGALSLDFLVSGTDVVIAIFLMIAMSFIPASFLVFLVGEKKRGTKHLQFISGTGPFTYWISNYIWDFFNYVVPAFLCISILWMFKVPAYTRDNNAYAVVALFLLYGWSMTPIMHLSSFCFSEPSTAYVRMIVINMFFGITTVLTTFMISTFNTNKTLVALNKKTQLLFLIFPNYNLGKGLMDLSYYEFMNDYYRMIGLPELIRDPFEWEIITRALVSMLAVGVIGFVLTLLCEYKFFTRNGFDQKKLESLPQTCQVEDDDVAAEKSRVDRISLLDEAEDLIVVNSISKVFQQHKEYNFAVNGLSFSVRRGECFGLLGVNGAGKTTTFKAITGVLNVSKGNIRVAGHMITGRRSHERLLAQQSAGYCPQFDALFDELTPIEHLRLYAKLRGVSKENEEQVVNWTIEKLDLHRHQHKPAIQLSGGNRRKLSVAIALVGNPPVILLDEPTSGMDPGARRFLWNLIRDLTRSGRAVLLTSHSMEECEVLCSRIAIMVNGKFKCLGPTQHLKNRFGGGYMVTITSSEPDLVIKYFKKEFPQATLKERNYQKVVFQISLPSETKETLQTSALIFEMLEKRKSELMVIDYSVTQTALDHVFNHFAKRQGSLDDVDPINIA